MEIRVATCEDAEALLEVYSYYVKNTAVSFEYEVPSVEEFRQRIKNTLSRYPYLVAVEDGQILGYAYASSFHTRKAYEHWAEASIYINKGSRKKGIGRSLYNELERILVSQNVYALCACIAVPEEEDEYLTFDSMRFHEKMGYAYIGKFERCGLKFDRWYSMIWMEKIIAERESRPSSLIPFPMVDITND